MIENITNRLRVLRKKAGLTQVELAQRAGTAQSHIANIEKGLRDIDFGLAQRLAKALNVKPYELMPEEWQPETISPEEREILNMIRKTKAPDNTDNNSSTKAG